MAPKVFKTHPTRHAESYNRILDKVPQELRSTCHACRTPFHFSLAPAALLRDLPEAWTLRNEGENTWSAFDRRQSDLRRTHGLDARAGWSCTVRLSRLRPSIVGTRTEVKEVMGNYKMNLPVCRPKSGRTVPESAARGTSRGAGGICPGIVTLSQLLATWAAHDLTHLHQTGLWPAIPRGRGPWSAYLGVLQCAGHSSP
jgi:hypothetical protein